MNATKKLYQVVERMRALTKAGVPFSFQFYSYQDSKGSSEGLKTVENAFLRTGRSKEFSDVADILIAYEVDDEPRFFYLPLLITFNNKYIHEH